MDVYERLTKMQFELDKMKLNLLLLKGHITQKEYFRLKSNITIIAKESFKNAKKLSTQF